MDDLMITTAPISKNDIGTKVYRLGMQFKSEKVENDALILRRISGWASTDSVDQGNDVVKPEGLKPYLDDYKRHPILLFGHDWFSKPIGQVTLIEIKEHGVWVEAEIANTSEGRDIDVLIEMGILKAFSIGFIPYEVTESTDDDKPNIISLWQLLELSIVNVPMNLEAVFEIMKSENLKLKSLINIEGKQRRQAMDELEQVQKDVTTVTNDLSTVKTDVNRLKDEFAEYEEAYTKVKRLENQITELKDSNSHTETDMKQRVDNLQTDFTTAVEDLNKAVNKLKEAQRPMDLSPILTVKDIMHRPTNEVRELLPDKEARMAVEFRNLTDDLVFMDAILECAYRRHNDGGNDAQLIASYPERRRQRLMGLKKLFDPWNEMRKAFDTETADEGLEWIPTIMSSRIYEFMSLEKKVPGLFESFQQPTATFQWPVEESDTIAKLIGQTITKQTTYSDSNEEQTTTGNVSFVAKKMRSSLQLSEEINEDAAFAILPYAQRRAGKGLTNALEQGTLDGDDTATHRDSDVTTSTDFRKAWNGLLEHAEDKSAEHDASGGVEAAMRTARQSMGVFGVDPSELAWIFGIQGYLASLIGGISNVQTRDKYGEKATIFTGELAKHDGIAIVVSPYMREDTNASGVYDGVTTTKKRAALVHRPSFLYGMRRSVNVSIEKNIPHDIWNVFAFMRVSFNTLEQPVGRKCVASLYNF